MGIKTVCEDLFSLYYKQALQTENPASEIGKKLDELERNLHSMRLFQYLLLIAEELEIEKPKELQFSKAFEGLLREVLKTFCERYMESQNCNAFVETFLNTAKVEMGNITDAVEDAIILILGFLVDKTLSEQYVVPKLKSILRELQGKNLPLL